MTGGALVAATIPARKAVAAPTDVAAMIAQLTGGKPIADGRVTLDLPAVAENGLSVPLTFAVDSPMSATDHVRAVHIFAEQNPLPHIASYRFSPLSPKAEVSIRIRLAKSQNVVALAEMADGAFYLVKREVSVTVGGCTG